MLNEFKKFILKGNVIDLATGVIIGAAFAGVVNSITEGIIKPLLQMIGGDPNVALKVGAFDLGLVINSIIGFLITAAVIFFVIIKPTNALLDRLKRGEEPPPPAPPTPDIVLLTEIRDLLKSRQNP